MRLGERRTTHINIATFPSNQWDLTKLKIFILGLSI